MAARGRAVPPPLWSGHERLRIGERLQASLAGILELDLLRETQRGTVEGALKPSQEEGGRTTVQQEEDPRPQGERRLPPATSSLDRSKSEDLFRIPKIPHASYSLSENIEADPRSLREGSEKECLGLRIINEPLPVAKKAGVNGGETQEMPEADSRPSSGFYETSEMGSLSDSCASVHSEGPGGSHSSVGSLSQLPGMPENGCIRPHSTDEASVRFLDLQLQRLSCMNAHGSDSRRPVSTGDLEFLLGLGDVSLPFSKNLTFPLLRYKSDLVSRNTNEIYHYPSPLHAVALQSPLFTSSLSQSSSQEDLYNESLGAAEADVPKSGAVCPPEQQRVRLDQYVAKLVLRYKCRSPAGRMESGYFAGSQKSLSMSSVCSSVLGASQLLAPGPGWKIRRRISTCSHTRSPEGSEGNRDSRILDFQGDLTPFPEISSIPANATSLSKISDPSVRSLPETLPMYPEPSVVSHPNKQPGELEKGRLSWIDGSPRAVVQVQTPPKKEASLPQQATDINKLYKGKHASRELVKTADKPEKGSERSWLNPRELLRRLSLRRRSSSRMGNRAHASSEINIHTACRSDPQSGKGKVVKPKWTSVLEISTKAPSHHRSKAGLFPPPHLTNHHLAFSSDSPATFCFMGESRPDLPLWPHAGLGKVEATSVVSLNGEWVLHPLGEKWVRTSATLNSTDIQVRSFKLRRSRSFKELKKAMVRSIRGSRTIK